MSAEVVALLVLAAAAAVAVVFTIIVVVTVDPSTDDAPTPDGTEGAPEREER